MCGFVSSGQSTTEALLVPVEGVLRPGLMVLSSLQTPTATPHLTDAFNVCISVAQDKFPRDDRISPGRDDRCSPSFSSRFVHLMSVIPTICREAFHRFRHLVQQTGQCCGIAHRGVRELDGQNVPTRVCGHMQLSPAAPTSLSPLRRRPLSLAEDAQTRRIDDEMDGFTGQRSL